VKLGLSLAGLFIISSAIFSGHFGVGDLIFPTFLGRSTGASWLIAALGYGFVNSVLVLLTYYIISIHKASLYGLTSKVLGKAFGTAYTTLAVLIIGPVFILPRVASATHEMAVAEFFPQIPLWVSLLIYFAFNYYIAYSRPKVMDKLGKYLAPALILFIIILAIKGILTPLSPVPSTGSATAFADGVLNAYNTMNALGAAIFGLWLLNELKLRRIEDPKLQARAVFLTGGFAAFGLFLTSTCLVYLGASSGSLFPTAEIGELTVRVAEGLLGYFGKAVFAILLALACITTSASLTSAAGDNFEQMSGGRIKYKYTVIASNIVGYLLGLVGLSRIIRYTVPWLMLIYPALIVMIFMFLVPDFSKVKLATQAGVITAMFFSIGDFLSGLGFEDTPFSRLNAALPLGSQGLAWLLPTIVAIALFQVIDIVRKRFK